MLKDHRLDFHSTFRRLAYFKLSTLHAKAEGSSNRDLDAYIASLLQLTTEPQMQDEFRAKADWKRWLENYGTRLESERGEWGEDAATDAAFDAAREKASRAANPRFVLRQWVLEEVIKKVEGDAKSGKRVLRKVLQVRVVMIHARYRLCTLIASCSQMACNPFEHWGAEDDPTPAESLDEEIREERRYCGIGEKQMLGFQCSCSS